MIVLLIFLTWVAKRTTFGRHVYAVGGNAEAARRAGINVKVIRWWVFGISGAMAGLGGVIFASRLSSVDLNAGGGTILLDAIAAAVIGGTSLFGGRGEVKSALLGALIIASIANGMSLLGYSSATQYIVTGVILLAAVTLDTISRRRLAAVGPVTSPDTRRRDARLRLHGGGALARARRHAAARRAARPRARLALRARRATPASGRGAGSAGARASPTGASR